MSKDNNAQIIGCTDMLTNFMVLCPNNATLFIPVRLSCNSIVDGARVVLTQLVNKNNLDNTTMTFATVWENVVELVHQQHCVDLLLGQVKSTDTMCWRTRKITVQCICIVGRAHKVLNLLVWTD